MKIRQSKIIFLFAAVGILTAIVMFIRGQKHQAKQFIPSLVVVEDEIPHHTGKSFASDFYQWHDSRFRPRKVGFVKNGKLDPTGNYGGYVRIAEYETDKGVRTCTGSSDENPGFGFLVNHYNDAKNENHWVTSLNIPGTSGKPLQGKHHAIHEYKWTMTIEGQPIDVTVHWFIADGQDNPIFAITHDLSRAKENTISADSRSPYGDIGWDGDQKSSVTGIGWGDRYKFKSTGSELSMKSSWDYREKNTIPYTHMWSKTANAEMGLVQTQTWQQHDAGGYWFFSSWGKKSEGPMPENWNWTYQLNQYQLESDPTSKRMAWGTNYGAVGQTEYNAYGDDEKLKGYPYLSYSVYMAMGEFNEHAVDQQVEQMENVQSVVISGKNIQAVSMGPAGVGRHDTVAYQPKGWDHVYGTWDLEQIAAGPLAFDFKVNQGKLKNPIFRIRLKNSARIDSVILGGDRLIPDQDFLMSFDEASNTAWITLVGNFSGFTKIVLNVIGE